MSIAAKVFKFVFIFFTVSVVVIIVGGYLWLFFDQRAQVIAEPEKFAENRREVSSFNKDTKTVIYLDGRIDPLYETKNDGWVFGVMPDDLGFRWFDDVFVRPILGGTSEFYKLYNKPAKLKKAHRAQGIKFGTMLHNDGFERIPELIYTKQLESKGVKVFRSNITYTQKRTSSDWLTKEVRKSDWQGMVMREKLPVECVRWSRSNSFNMGVTKTVSKLDSGLENWYRDTFIPFAYRKYGMPDLKDEDTGFRRIKLLEYDVAFLYKATKPGFDRTFDSFFSFNTKFIYFFDGRKDGYDFDDMEGWSLIAASVEPVTRNRGCGDPFHKIARGSKHFYEYGTRYPFFRIKAAAKSNYELQKAIKDGKFDDVIQEFPVPN